MISVGLCVRISETPCARRLQKKKYIGGLSGTLAKYEPLPIKAEAVETFQKRWAAKGIGWFAEVVDDSKYPGYKKVFAYYGSSTYDTVSMSRLLEYLKQDMTNMGLLIPVSKAEEERMLNEWHK